MAAVRSNCKRIYQSWAGTPGSCKALNSPGKYPQILWAHTVPQGNLFFLLLTSLSLACVHFF